MEAAATHVHGAGDLARKRAVRSLSLRPALITALGLLGPTAFSPCAGQTPEYEVKAVILERLTDFVEWPEASTVHDPATPFVVGVFGENPFGTLLHEQWADARIWGNPVSVRQVSEPAELTSCHLLFIGDVDEETLANVLSLTQHRAILTVSDRDGFAERGVLVNLELADDRVQLVVNAAAVGESGLRVSHLLMGMARIVNPQGDHLP